MKKDKYVVVAQEYACDGVWFSQVVAKGSYKSCCEYSDLINSGGVNEYRDAEVMSEAEYGTEI